MALVDPRFQYPLLDRSVIRAAWLAAVELHPLFQYPLLDRSVIRAEDRLWLVLRDEVSVSTTGSFGNPGEVEFSE